MKTLTAFVILAAIPLYAADLAEVERQSRANVSASAKVAPDALRAWAKSLPRAPVAVPTMTAMIELPLDQAQLGDAYASFFVRLDQLSAFRPGVDPADLLVDTKEVTYLVNVDHEPKATLTMRQKAEKWRSTSFGAANLATKIVALTRRIEAPGGQAPDAFLVKIPALNLVFLGHRSQARLMLSAVVSNPSMDVKEGTTYDANQLFQSLAEKARRHNGRPS